MYKMRKEFVGLAKNKMKWVELRKYFPAKPDTLIESWKPSSQDEQQIWVDHLCTSS